jgi:hypothetical protein
LEFIKPREYAAVDAEFRIVYERKIWQRSIVVNLLLQKFPLT